MLLRKHIPKKCRLCQSTIGTIQEESYGCDGCGKSIDDLLASPNTQRHEYLGLTIHFQSKKPAEYLQFCSWRCVIKRIRTIQTDYFVTLPFLHFERDVMTGQGVKDFLKCVRK